MTMNENLEKLNHFSTFEKNWNGYEADPLPDNIIEVTRKILKRLSVQPEMFPTARDSIQLEYERENGDYLEFEIKATGVEVFISPASNPNSRRVQFPCPPLAEYNIPANMGPTHTSLLMEDQIKKFMRGDIR